jgi:pimeloyl-ACP methyl ester carboxylesterase
MTSVMRRIVRASSCVALLLASVSSACTAPAPAPVGDVTWHPCNTVVNGAQCGTLPVFENRASAQGRKIDIAFLVLRADDSATRAQDALFVFAGGPGQASTDGVRFSAAVLEPLRSTLDLVFVDQRGTGGSHALTCDATASADPASAFGHVFNPDRVAGCRADLSHDADLTRYTTDDAVADVEAVRAALGYERVSLLGTSYGTRMAQAYMRRFPSRVRSAVMDAVAPIDMSLPLEYAKTAQQSLDRVWIACASNPDCHAAHPQIAADFDRLLHRFDSGPVPTKMTAAGSQVIVQMQRGDFGYAVRGILYSDRGVTSLADMVGRASASGDFSEFANQYWAREAGMERSLALGLHLAVLCAEDVPFASDAEVVQATSGTFLGRYLFDEYRNACQSWPRAKLAADARKPVTARVPTLLVSGAFDPSTPPQFADHVARSLPLSLSVTSSIGAHGSAFGCARDAVIHVLARGTLEGMPAVCR